MIGGFHRRVGFKGSFLVAFALVDFTYATWLITGPPSGTTEWFNSVVPIMAWAGVWIAVGVICLVQAFRDPLLGLHAAIAIKVVWGLGCVFGWVMADVPISSVGIWGFFAWCVWRISGWPEQPVIGKDRDHDDP